MVSCSAGADVITATTQFRVKGNEVHSAPLHCPQEQGKCSANSLLVYCPGLSHFILFYIFYINSTDHECDSVACKTVGQQLGELTVPVRDVHSLLHLLVVGGQLGNAVAQHLHSAVQ